MRRRMPCFGRGDGGSARQETVFTIFSARIEVFAYPVGRGKQSVWLAASGSQTPFCGRWPTPTLRSDSRGWERNQREEPEAKIIC